MKSLISLVATLITGVVALSSSSLSLAAPELMLDKTQPNLGVGVYPRTDDTWRSKALAHPDRVTDADRVWSGPEFFKGEYGQPLDFSADFIAKHGYSSGGDYTIKDGELSVKTGPKGFAFGFGALPNNREIPAIRLGSTWGKNRKDNLRLQLVLQQNVNESQWTLSTASPTGYNVLHTFKIRGREKQTFEVDVTSIRHITSHFFHSIGLKLECQTPNVNLRLDSVKLAPSSANVYYRKQFTLAEKPVMAHATYNDFDTHELYVNGRRVAAGTRIYPSGSARIVDLTPYLQAGANTIAHSREFLSWHGEGPQGFLFEGVAVSRNGAITRILGDDSWKASYRAPQGWMNPDFDASNWKNALAYTGKTRNIGRPFVTSQWDGSAVFAGVNPRHMGMLDVAPQERQYPLFEYTETPAFRVRLPAGAQNRTVSAEVYQAGTQTLVERVAAPAFALQGDFKTAVVRLKKQPVGPYRVEWKLSDASGQVQEQRREELIVIGPLPQDKVPLATFEQNLENRLERVQHIDATQPPATDDFLDHAGMYNAPKLNKGQVKTANGLTYRETGPNTYDYFAYRLHGLQRGEPYLVEVVVPDDAERGIYSAVVETRPVNYFNNQPGMGWIATSGSARTGGRYPLSGGWRKIRYLYTPGSTTAGVTVINKLRTTPAAAREINIYRIKGGLPALDVPTSSRSMGPHEERIILNAWSFAAENPLEGAPPIALNGHQDAWFNWYRIYERKIQFLRHQGFNMTVEGVFMYEDAFYPKSRNGYLSNDELDIPLLALKMYKHNGIKMRMGVEYVVDSAVAVDGVDTVSDRRMWQGEESVQTVDRYGRQVGRGIWGNGNFLHLTTKKYLHGIINEIYGRYHDQGPVEGVYMITSGWWIPGFRTGAYSGLSNDEVGYDDTTTAQFEKETGIQLNISTTDPKRFGKRYDALMGPHKDAWMTWRAQKTRGSFSEIGNIIRSKPQKWDLLIESGMTPAGPGGLTKALVQSGDPVDVGLRTKDMPVALFANDPHTTVAAALPATSWHTTSTGENIVLQRALLTSAEVGAAVQRLKGLAIGGSLDELDAPSAAAQRWIWSNGTGRGVFVSRGIEDNAMNDFVTVLANGIPETIIYSWIDMNQEMAHGPQLRRFNKSFYVTPTDVNFEAVPPSRARGVVTQVATGKDGISYLRLINPTPYPVSGSFTTTATAARDLVYDQLLTAQATTGSSRRFTMTLPPNDIRIIRLAGGQGAALGSEFDFDAETTARVLQQAGEVLQTEALAEAIPAVKREALRVAVASGSAVRAQNLLDDWEVVGVTTNAQTLIRGQENQTRLLEAIEARGIARIDTGAGGIYTDQDGNKWLPDQPYLSGQAYGYSNAEVASRGAVEIPGNRFSHIFRREIWGSALEYRVPLPNGRYKVTLHFAETYAPNKEPGSRIFSVAVQDGSAESIDLIARAGGQFRAYAFTAPAQVTDGLLKLRLGGNALLNGVTIEKN
ncbi:MAG: hypothetical protein KY445_08355 [Armatimonadetes bacterium]|nr:hypothetical protein [Armatimonadota bacterium]